MKTKIITAIYYLFAYHLPPPPFPLSIIGHTLRRVLCRYIFKETGSNFLVGTKVNFGSGSNIRIGEGSNIGAYSWISNDVEIGDNVMMGPEVIILSDNHSHDRIDIPMTEQGQEERRPVKIEDDVWVGARVIILPGVVIGAHSIVGAGAVVTKSIPEYSVAVGNPARVVKDRRGD